MADSYTKPIQLDDAEVLRVANVLRENISIAESAISEPLSEVEQWRDYLRDERDDAKKQWKYSDDDPRDLYMPSTITVPYLKSAKMALEAEIFPAVLEVDPLVHVEGADKPSQEMADDVERYYQRLHIQKLRTDRVWKRVTDYALRDGSCMVMQVWDKREQMVWAREYRDVTLIDPMTGVPVVSVEPEDTHKLTVVYDYPKIIPVEFGRYFSLPSYDVQDIQTCSGLGVWYNLTGEDIIQGIRNGMFRRREALELLAQDLEVTGDTADDKIRGITPSKGNTSEDRERQQRTYKVYQIVMKYSPAANVPASDWLFTIADAKDILLRAQPYPYFGTHRKFALVRPYSYDATIAGDSLASMGGGHVQEAKSSLIRLAINMTMRSVYKRQAVPQSLYNQIKEKMLDKATLQKPGEFFPVLDTLIQSGKLPIIPLDDGNDPRLAIEAAQYLDEEGEKYLGISRLNQGCTLPGDVSATEAMTVAESAKRLVGQVIQNVSQPLGDVTEQMHELMVQFAPGSEACQRLWQTVNGNTGIALEQALQGDYVFTANGGYASTKMVLSKQAMDRLAILQNEPNVMQNPTRRYKLLSDALQYGTNARNPQDYLGTVEEWEQQAAMEAQAVAQQMAMEQQAQAEQAEVAAVTQGLQMGMAGA